MQIIEFQAENIKKLKVVRIKPTGPIVQLTGANGEGKTSVLDSILYCLAGTEDLPSQPLRKGTTKGGVYIDLGEFMVKRTFTESGTSLIVESKDGARYQKPQQMLDRLFGPLSFDPLAFTRMKPKEQSEALRKLVRIDVDLDAIDKANEEDYELRRIANRNVKEYEAQVNAISIVAELPEKPIDVTKLIGDLETAGSHNAEIERMSGDLTRRMSILTEKGQGIVRYRSEIDSLMEDIERIKQNIRIKETAIAHIEKEIAEGNLLVAADQAVKWEKIDTASLREEIENARATNSQIAKRTEREAIQAKLDAEKATVETLNEKMKERNEEKSHAIATAAMPVPGLGFEKGEVTYNDLPLNQASGAEQLRVSCAIAMASNPEVRIIRIADGSLLDDKSLEIIKQLAIDRDYQIWIERVDTSGKIGIVMEDGLVKAVNEDEAAAPAEKPAKTTSKKK